VDRVAPAEPLHEAVLSRRVDELEPLGAVAEHALVRRVGRERAAQVELPAALASVDLEDPLDVGLDRRREAARDGVELARAELHDERRQPRLGVGGELVCEAVVAAVELRDAVVVQVPELVARVSPLNGRARVRRAGQAVDPGVEAAVRAARVDVEQHLGLAVAVQVGHP
jgi:hypothetical protein